MRQNITGDSGKVYGDGVYLDSNLLDGLSDKERVQMVKARIAELGGQTFTAYDGDTPVEIKIESHNKSFINNNGKRAKVNNDLATKNINRKIKQETVVLSDEIIRASKFKESVPSKYSHGWLDNKGHGNWERRTVFVQEKNNSVWEATLHIANTQNGEKILYDIDPIKIVDGTASPSKKLGTSPATSTTDSIRQGGENVNTQFSMRVDSEGRELSEAQQEFFKDSKVRDEEGRLLTVYHGSDKEFFVFDRTKARANMDIQGSFFSPWEIDAQGYGGKVGEYYLNIVNPASEAMGYKALKKFQGQNGAGIKAREYLQSLGYDGVNNGGEEYIAFESNQIKSVTNQTPTENPDIRYSMRGENWKPTLDKVEWRIVNYAIENKTGKELTETTDYFFRKEKGKTVFGIYSTDDSTLLYAVHGEKAYQEYNLVKDFKEGIENAAYSGTKRSNTWDETARVRYGTNAVNGDSALASGRYSGNDTLYGKQHGSNASRALQNVLENLFGERQTDGSRGSGEPGEPGGSRGSRGLTVSDLGKIQYQLRIEDKNRLDILDRQETRLTADLKTLEKAYAEAIRAEYERSIKPGEETSRRAAEINRKAAKRKPTEQKREPPAVVLFFICSVRECS